jgi:translation initiation factor 2 subunit 3
LKINPLIKGEILLLNVNSAKTVGMVSSLGKGIAHLNLRLPVCADISDKVTISRKLGTRFRLIGYGDNSKKIILMCFLSYFFHILFLIYWY